MKGTNGIDGLIRRRKMDGHRRGEKDKEKMKGKMKKED